jgi:hypothetical protein
MGLEQGKPVEKPQVQQAGDGIRSEIFSAERNVSDQMRGGKPVDDSSASPLTKAFENYLKTDQNWADVNKLISDPNTTAEQLMGFIEKNGETMKAVLAGRELTVQKLGNMTENIDLHDKGVLGGVTITGMDRPKT